MACATELSKDERKPMKLKRLELELLSERIGIELLRLQYCVNESLVPERAWMLQADDESQLDGIDELTGTFLVSASLLLDAGYTERRIHSLLKTICLVMKPGRNPLRLPVAADIVGGATSVVVQISDGDHIRWKVDCRDTGWIRIYSGKRYPVPHHEPLIVTAIDLSSIHNQVLGR